MPKEQRRPSLVEKTVSLGAPLAAGIWAVPDIERGIAYARKIQRLGDGRGGAILNILGEHHETIEDVNRDAEKYKQLVDAIVTAREKGKLNAVISIKPTQFGFQLDSENIPKPWGGEAKAVEKFTRDR